MWLCLVLLLQRENRNLPPLRRASSCKGQRKKARKKEVPYPDYFPCISFSINKQSKAKPGQRSTISSKTINHPTWIEQFRLCANMAPRSSPAPAAVTDGNRGREAGHRFRGLDGGQLLRGWARGRGRSCVLRVVQPDLHGR